MDANVCKVLYGIAEVLFNHGNLDIKSVFICKALSAAMGTIACVITYLIGREFFNRQIGTAAAIILAVIPVFVAHNQQAALDTPVATMFTVQCSSSCSP